MHKEQWIHTQGSYEISTRSGFLEFDVNVFKDFSIWMNTEKSLWKIHFSLHMLECKFELVVAMTNEFIFQIIFINGILGVMLDHGMTVMLITKFWLITDGSDIKQWH